MRGGLEALGLLFWGGDRRGSSVQRLGIGRRLLVLVSEDRGMTAGLVGGIPLGLGDVSIVRNSPMLLIS